MNKVAPSPRETRLMQYAELMAKAKQKGPGHETETVRLLALTDLFYLLVFICRCDFVNNDFMFARCCDIQENPDGHLDLWARGHGKSTIVTFGKTIQDILLNRDVTIGILSHTRPIAKSFLRQIMRELDGNETLKSLFPEVLYPDPRKQSPKWAEDDGIIVRRQSNPREATVEAWGLVDSQPTSKHFKVLMYDDVVTEESINSPDMIRKTTKAWELSCNLVSSEAVKRYAGTIYHFHDTYREIMDRGAAIPRIYPATINGTPDGDPVYLTREELDSKRREMGPYTFSCQMLLNPIADELQKFQREWIQFYTMTDGKRFAGHNWYITVDPANSKEKNRDYTAMFVFSTGPDQNIYILDMIRDRLNISQRAATLTELHRIWTSRIGTTPNGVGVEEYGMTVDGDYIRMFQEKENYRFPIKSLGGRARKDDRIKRLLPYFEQRRIYFPNHIYRVNAENKRVNLVESFINDEYLTFPVGGHDDMLDCLARLADSEFGVSFPRHEPTVFESSLGHQDWLKVTGNTDGPELYGSWSP